MSRRFQGWGGLSALIVSAKGDVWILRLEMLKEATSLFSAVYLIDGATCVFHREEMPMKSYCCGLYWCEIIDRGVTEAAGV